MGAKEILESADETIRKKKLKKAQERLGEEMKLDERAKQKKKDEDELYGRFINRMIKEGYIKGGGGGGADSYWPDSYWQGKTLPTGGAY